MDEERIQLTSEESGERIDALLSRIYPGLSRSLIQKCIEAGAVTLDGRAIKKNARAQAGGELLFRYYIDGEPMKAIASSLNYTEANCWKLHKKGLQELYMEVKDEAN